MESKKLNSHQFSDEPVPYPAEWRNCLGRICSWRVPSNWGKEDWFEEISAVAVSAACEAELAFDSSRGVPLCVFVRSRVLGRALARYRQEWTFAYRCVCSNLEEEDGNIPARGPEFLTCASLEERACDGVLEALTWLDESKRFVIEQLFWLDRTEAEIGLDLGISQRAVSKRKICALRALQRVVKSLQ